MHIMYLYTDIPTIHIRSHTHMRKHTFVENLENRAIEPYIQVTGLHYMYVRGHIVLAPVALEALVANT